MPAPAKCIAAFCLVSFAVFCWWTSWMRGDSAQDEFQSVQPRLLSAHMLMNAQPLQHLHDSPVIARSRFDPQVMLASAIVPQVGSFAITQVSQAGVVWPIKPQGSDIRLIDNTAVTITGTGTTVSNIKVTVNDIPATITPAQLQPANLWVITVTFPTAGKNKLIVADGANASSPALFLTLPTSNDLEIRQPTITQVSNNAYKDVSSIPQTVSVYGRHLELAGEKYLSGTQLSFPVFKKDAKTGEFVFVEYAGLKRASEPRQDAIWQAELELPQMISGEEGYVLVMATKTLGDLHRYSNNIVGARINFKIDRGDNPLDAPTQPVIKTSDGTAITPDASGLYRFKAHEFQVSGTASGDAKLLADSRIVVFLNNNRTDIKNIEVRTTDGNKWSGNVKVETETAFAVTVATVLGKDLIGRTSTASSILIRSSAPSVVRVEQSNASMEQIKVTFSEPVTIPTTAENLRAAFLLVNSKNETTNPVTTTLPTLDKSDNSLTLTYADVRPDVYTFIVKSSIANLFGTAMEKDYPTKLFRSIGGEEPVISRGITGPTGANVEFPEYLNPRAIVDGFNPSDHIETRVARLYYFRDAHRVAQIINRDAQSYNRAAVKMEAQLADKARTIANQATDDRRAKEREAVRASEKTREAEQELQQAEANAQRAAAEAANANAQIQQKSFTLNNPIDPPRDPTKSQLQNDIQQLTATRSSLEQVFEAAQQRASNATAKVQALRSKEAEAQERWQGSIAVEDRAREDQFRREVAAAHADPDTYAAGKPDSQDPVRQVSVSVIGEGLIQLRGPIKGINIIRTMINQIDAPVGQVRVGVHTVQINGEKGDRMEVVANKIQRFVDHSRFLTLQSAEMLRKAIVQVAAQRANECGNVPGLSQADRDRSYLHSFFGEDFVRELETMDSEFLATGNKLLSIHSMDSTSLASAMFMMALAKNSTRTQIQQTFEEMMAGELPMAEQNYFEAGLTCDGKHKLFDKHCHRNEFTLLSQNARFQSIRGMFNVEIAEDDTMTPIQREFVRLAQIFKSRLIVELELKQRVMERSVIEERLGDREKELRVAREKEETANNEKRKAQGAVRTAQKATKHVITAVQTSIPIIRQQVDRAQTDAARIASSMQRIVDALIGNNSEWWRDLERLAQNRERQGKTKDAEAIRNSPAFGRDQFNRPLDGVTSTSTVGQRIRDFRRSIVRKLFELGVTGVEANEVDTQDELELVTQEFTVTLTKNNEIVLKGGRQSLQAEIERAVASAKEIRNVVARFKTDTEQEQNFHRANDLFVKIQNRGSSDAELLDSVHRAMFMAKLYTSVASHLAEVQLCVIEKEVQLVDSALGRDGSNLDEAYSRWLSVERQFAEKAPLGDAPAIFQLLAEANLDYQFALQDAEASRRPLDHKKFLDMLVDEMEDKYIELLEGTRAHTANIDAYIKRLMTTLDDDFNTQFYFPTFRKVRESSQMWDVQLGQVETTNVLVNNRAFGKVSPEATMEFDLPKRDILITEAIGDAKAVIDDIGALAQDPTFLALAQMKSGSPTSSPMAGAIGGQATVRNVLPGLSTDTAESVMGQQGPGGSRFGSAMEALIPDPAIYKFETGTGWEIRPVIQPDGQALVFHFNYMYTTNVREPVRPDEKHLGRVKRHFVDTDVQLSNFELREISRYTVALKASRTSRGVPLLEDAPIVGALFRPQPSDESSLQQNVILGQATIFPTVFDLMGLRWAPVVADLDPLRLSNDEFIVRNRRRAITNRVFDHSSSEVDKFLRIPDAERRMDLYRSQETIPSVHPNGYDGPGANLRDSQMQEGYDPARRQETQFIPGSSIEGSLELQERRKQTGLQNEMPLMQPKMSDPSMQPKSGEPSTWDNSSSRNRTPATVTNAGYQSKPQGINAQRSTKSSPRPNTPTPPANRATNAVKPASAVKPAPNRLPQLSNPFSRGQPKK